MSTSAGFAAILGAPNAGKSTLTNALVGEKVSIVTHKVQTTRFPVRAIAMLGDAQVVLIDTPGVFEGKDRLAKSMVKSAWDGLKEADAVLHIVDAQAQRNGETLSIKDTAAVTTGLAKRELKPALVLNKIDLFPRDELLPLVAEFQAMGVYGETFLISATDGNGLAELKTWLAGKMPAGPYLFPPDQAADIPVRLMAAEITREKLFLRLHDELPYASTVETESWQDRRDGSVRIEQTVYVRRDSQKPIVLGKGGQTIKGIGAAARREMERWLGRKVHLFLFVKVRANWNEDRARFDAMGLEFDIG